MSGASQHPRAGGPRKDRDNFDLQAFLPDAPAWQCPHPCGKIFNSDANLSRHLGGSQRCNRRYELRFEELLADKDFELDVEEDWPGNPYPASVVGESDGDDEPMMDDFGMDIDTGDCELRPATPLPLPTGPAPAILDEIYPNAGRIVGTRPVYFEQVQETQRQLKASNSYYPFRDRADFHLAAWLHSSGLSTRKIDDYFQLEHVSCDLP